MELLSFTLESRIDLATRDANRMPEAPGFSNGDLSGKDSDKKKEDFFTFTISKAVDNATPLPGGFVGTEESPEQTAERKLREKTGVASVHLEQLRTYAEPDRDPECTRSARQAHGFQRRSGRNRLPTRSGFADALRGQQRTLDLHEVHVGGIGNAGIAPEMAGQPTLQLRLAAFITLFEEAARRTQQDNFGLWFGNQFMPRDLGLWGYAAISSPTRCCEGSVGYRSARPCAGLFGSLRLSAAACPS